MMLIKIIDKRIEEFFKRYLEENFDIEEELMKEAGYTKESSKNFSSNFFSFLCERLYLLCLKKDKIINSHYLIKQLPKETTLSFTEPQNKDRGYEIFQGIFIYKNIFIKILEKIGLEKTKQVYINWMIINDDELISTDYFSEKQIKKYKEEYIINEIFAEEYEEKLKNKPKII